MKNPYEKDEKGKLLRAIQTARATAEDAGGLGLCLAGVLEIVETSFKLDQCRELSGILIAYGKEKIREEEGELGIKNKATRAIEIAEKLSKVEPWPVRNSEKELIPCDKGLYIFRQDGKAVYVGMGAGRNGLRGRIWNQHLAQGYRKSVLRKKVMVAIGLEESLQYIRENFTLAFFSSHMDDLVTMKLAELLLIAWHRPIYNSEAEEE